MINDSRVNGTCYKYAITCTTTQIIQNGVNNAYPSLRPFFNVYSYSCTNQTEIEFIQTLMSVLFNSNHEKNFFITCVKHCKTVSLVAHG